MAKKTTMQDVAAEANVSLASVSLYLNNKPGLSDTTRQRIAEAVTKLRYTPRKANGSESTLIGLLVERLPFSMFSELHYGDVLHSMEAAARDLGYNLILVIVEPGQNISISERLRNLGGVIVLGGGDITAEVISSTLEVDIPVVLVDVSLPGRALNCILVDNQSGAFQSTRYLIERGYQRIACIQGPKKYPSLIERFQGYCFALIDAGIPLEAGLIQPPISSGFPNKGYREMLALLERGERFDAVFCVSDRTAFGALQALQEAGLRVPQDVAVIGFDNTVQSSYTTPPLTTVNMPKKDLGEVAVHRLYDLMNGETLLQPVKIVLPTSLVIRDST
ncbi:MAG: LacI family DNA-binding transcriptional regulator [Anaerolineae bacterium]|nr:LacI family DNA-binding transcriptional regulator [Chloroflexota bacterium]MBN8635013.1 LacI family DNA-binding transcriptional regulator [Anaerolineae bacterium]